MNVVIIVNFKRIQIFRKEIKVLTYTEVFAFKMLKVLDEIRNLSS